MTRLFARSLNYAVKAGATILLSVAGLLLAGAQSAEAMPSFARQTGQQCAACHNGFPELTPYGRQFKENGFTFSNSKAPPIPLAMLIIDSDTHTQKSADAPVVPGTARNDNLVLDAAALFYAGKVTSNIGAYVAGAYSQLSHRFALAQTDIRYANTAHVFGKTAIFGVSINDNPALTDPWNTSASYNSYPYESSHVVVGPVASTAIQGRYANQVIGANGYVSWNRWLYAAAGVYTSVDRSTLDSLGMNTFGASSINGAAPYWRVALEPAWGHSTLEFGTFGMSMNVNPLRITTAGTDHTVDVGVDTEYQYLSDGYSLSAAADYIYERSNIGPSKTLGLSSNSKDTLNTWNVRGTYIYDQTYGANLGYFRTDGSRDHALYGAAGAADGSPNSDGWTGEIDYYPFNRGGPAFWRELGLKFGLQYVYYSHFDGAATNYDGLGRSASANNTLFLYTWTAF
jgi:hypothetical protein